LFRRNPKTRNMSFLSSESGPFLASRKIPGISRESPHPRSSVAVGIGRAKPSRNELGPMPTAWERRAPGALELLVECGEFPWNSAAPYT
jgi:hypothetical protein